MTASPADESRSHAFYAGALTRIPRLILAAGVVAIAVCWTWLGWQAAAGCAVGVLAGYESFTGLVRAVNGLAGRITEQGSRESGGRIVARFLLRYLWAALAAYVIFSVSRTALLGFLAGLCLPVAAMMLEAGYEAWAAVRRGL